MALKLYNTLTRNKDEFVPLKAHEVGFYSCGPTVYNFAHIGNLRTYIFNDVLKRVLLYNGYKVKHVMNITDVGHLTDDADYGEDRMEKGASREGKTVWEVAEYYARAFQSDIKKLNILEPDIWCKATGHIEVMIDMIKKIEANGYTYEAGGNVYFDTSKFTHYTGMARLRLDDLEAGARTDVDQNKKHPRDFVLWFTLAGSKYGKQHSMKWDSPWGVGYPGWHIECSAMSTYYLGEQFDIHTGGIDHIPLHHTNEIAQAEAATGKHPWVAYWLHANFLVIKENKMAKSSGNFIALSTIEENNFHPMAYRYFCHGAHYRTELSFSWEALEHATNGYNRFKNKIIDLKHNEREGNDDTSAHVARFEEAINDDLNMPVALAVAWDLLNDTTIGTRAKYETLLKFDTVLGLNIAQMEEEELDVSEALMQMIEKREEARKNKDWSTADKMRNEIQSRGYEVLDTPNGAKLKKK